ncbi:MAG TPA: hypothetical protein PL015_04850 [Opitutaceae bacterium]|nr:hypothetical protein [Opitutaceae bacterium]
METPSASAVERRMPACRRTMCSFGFNSSQTMKNPSLLIALDIEAARLSALVAPASGPDGQICHHGFIELPIPPGSTPQSLSDALCPILAAHVKSMGASERTVPLLFCARSAHTPNESFHAGRPPQPGEDFIWRYADGSSCLPAPGEPLAHEAGDFAAQFVQQLGVSFSSGEISVWPAVLAMGLGVTTRAERQVGVLAVEVGPVSSEYIYFAQGRVVYHGTLTAGVQTITNALAGELRFRAPEAEALVYKWAHRVPRAAGNPSGLWQFGDYRMGDRWVSCAALETILRRVVGDAFCWLRRQIEAAEPERAKPEQVVIAGCGVYLNVIGQVVASAFMPAAVRCVESEDRGTVLRGGGTSALLGMANSFAAEVR